MSLSNDALYVQVHPLTYMAKLYIEMNIAEFLGKILKQSNRRRNSFSLSNDCHNLNTCNGWQPDLEATATPHDYMFNREWRKSKDQFHVKPSGGQMHPLNMDLLADGEKNHDDPEKWGGIHGAGSYDAFTKKGDEVGEPSTPSSCHVREPPWPTVEVKRRSSSSEEMRHPSPRQIRPRMPRMETCVQYDDGDDASGDTTVDGQRANRCLSRDLTNSRRRQDSGIDTDMDTDALMQGAIQGTKTYSDHEEDG